jgi:hypothetical protein
LTDPVIHPALPGPVPWAGEVTILALGRPDSYNSLGSRGSNHRQHAQKKEWQNIWAKLLMAEHPRERWAYAEASALIRYAKQWSRPPDEDNFRPALSKALGDALDGGADYRPMGGRWLPDDSTEFFRFREVNFEVVKPLKGVSPSLLDPRPVRKASPATLVTLRWLERCPKKYAWHARRGPAEMDCVLPVGHVGECVLPKVGKR